MSPDELSNAEREINDLDTTLAGLRKSERQGLEAARQFGQQHRDMNGKVRLLQADIDAKDARRNDLFQAVKRHRNEEAARLKAEADKKRAGDEAAAAEAAAKAASEQAESGNGE